MAVVRVIDWSETSRGVESKVILVWKQIVMDYFSIFFLVLFRNFWQSCCLLQIFCCKILKMPRLWLFMSKFGLKMFPDLGRVKKTRGRQTHPFDV